MDHYSILLVGPNQEATISRSLSLISLQHEWFRIRRRVIYRGRLILRTFPIFPGYMFVLAEYLWAQIEAITGVRGFVRFGGTIETVPARVVLGLRERADDTGILDEGDLPFRPGQAVWIQVGGRETPGVFVDYAGPARAFVEVEMFGHLTSVSARLGDLKSAE